MFTVCEAHTIVVYHDTQCVTGNGHLFFSVKFYVSDPSKLQEEYTRYHFYLQIRKDILQGRFLLPPSTACLLASYTVQCEYLTDTHFLAASQYLCVSVDNDYQLEYRPTW